MPLIFRVSCVLVIFGLFLDTQTASAESSTNGASEPFFTEGHISSDTDTKKSRVSGSLASTSFLHYEAAGVSQIGGAAVENASPVNRLFTELRGQLRGERLGGSWDTRLDGRARFNLDSGIDSNFQSGTFGNQEFEVREAYIKREGKTVHFALGRQFVTELASFKVDGLRIDFQTKGAWTYFGVAGLYPTRGSRSIGDDYPKSVPNVEAPETKGGRIFPAIAGVGGRYNFKSYYGSVAGFGISSLTDDQETGTTEKPRLGLAERGYWRTGNLLDIYHQAVVEFVSAGGFRVPNLSIGVDYHPKQQLRFTAAIHHVDTETLNATAQTRLDQPDPVANAFVQNNITVSRVSTQSLRLGASYGFRNNRFQVSLSGQLRNRPEITLLQLNNIEVTVPASRAAEIGLEIRDRRSVWNLDASLRYSRTFGIGDNNLNRTTSDLIRLSGRRTFKDSKMEAEVDLSYLVSNDEDRGAVCVDIGNPLDCYGTAGMYLLSVGGVVFYRFRPEWFVLGSLSLGIQHIEIVDQNASDPQPKIYMATGLAKVARRF